MPGTDFDGDGRDDMIFRDDVSGQVMTWLGQANGSFAYNQYAGNEPAYGTLVAIGDWNADGRSDTLWWMESGEVYSALTGIEGNFSFGWSLGYVDSMQLSWHAAGTGDFNGDGRDDVLWANPDGSLTIWKTEGDYIVSTVAEYQLPAGWIVTGTGDFNGDGRDDALLRHDDGTITNWLGQADGRFASNHDNAVYNLAAGWYLAGIGDFNGDDRDDLLLRDADGVMIQWLGTQTGAFVENETATYALPLSWHVKAVGDYNGDGFDDLFLRDDAGTITNWLGSSSGHFTANHSVAVYALSHDWEAVSNPLAANVWDYF